MLTDTPYTIEEILDLYCAVRTHRATTSGRFTKVLRLIATVFAEREARSIAELESERLRTENAELRDRLTPKPIETAPTDGSLFMTYYSDGGQALNRVRQWFSDGEIHWHARPGCSPTHWSSLLPSPSELTP